MTISVLHPSRNRPEQAASTINHWIEMADDELEYILSLDSDEIHLDRYIDIANHYGVKYIVNNNTTAIQAINQAAKVCNGDLIVQIADDFFAHERWDSALRSELWDKKDFVLKTIDGIQPVLVTLPIVDRAWYDRFGYIYFEGYKHLFCDQELTTVAMFLGRYIKCDLVFEHRHPITGKVKNDALNHRNNATFKQGSDLFNERLKNNFGIDNPIINYNQIKWH